MQEDDNKKLLNIYNANITYFHNQELNFLFHDKKPHNYSISISNDLDKITNNDHFSIFTFILLRLLFLEIASLTNELTNTGVNFNLEFKKYPFRCIEDYYFGLRYSNNRVQLDLRNLELAHINVDKILLIKIYSNSIEALQFNHHKRISDNLIANRYLYSPDFLLHNTNYSSIFISSDDDMRIKTHSINDILDFDSDLYKDFKRNTLLPKKDILQKSELEWNKDVINHAYVAEKQIFEGQKLLYLSIGKSELEAETLAREECTKRVQIAKNRGLYFLPPNLGELIFSKQVIQNPTIRDLVEKIRNRLPYLESEGVTKDDIIKWWNIHYLERQKMSDDDNTFQLARIMTDTEELVDLDYRSQLENYKRYFPTFSEDSRKISEDDPLPIELKIRVIQYKEKYMWGDTKYKEAYNRKIDKCTSFNALVRSEIKKRNI